MAPSQFGHSMVAISPQAQLTIVLPPITTLGTLLPRPYGRSIAGRIVETNTHVFMGRTFACHYRPSILRINIFQQYPLQNGWSGTHS